MSERDNILSRVRRALAIQAPKPGRHGPAPGGTGVGQSADGFDHLLPATGGTFEQNLALFQKNALELRAEFWVLESAAALPDHLAKLRDAEDWKKIATHAGALTEPAAAALGLPICRTDAGYNVADLEACEVGLTECDALVAHTGSVLVTSRSAGGRALSVLPPHHVVLARRDQLVGSLPDALTLLKRKYAPNYPSLISFITGPSRTGDIERVLVLGAHGPKRLTILLLGH